MMFDNVDGALPRLARRLRIDGAEVGSRLGERTQEILHAQIILRHPWQREVLVPDRGANVAAQIAETMWVLAGRNDVAWLSHYLPRAADFSDDGQVWRGGYGPRLRDYSGQIDDVDGIDQIRHIVDLLSEDRSSRRAVVSIYDPAVDSAPGKDIPCNDFLSFISRDGRLDLSVFVRSNDLIWGWSGINAFEWSVLQEIVAGILGLQVGSLVFSTTSLHVYDRHWEKARRIEEGQRFVPVAFQDSPRFDVSAVMNAPTVPEHPIDALDMMIQRWFDMEQRIRTGGFLPGEDTQLINGFPEPMMRSWLQVLAWYWSGEERHRRSLEGTRLWAATEQIPQSILDRARQPVTLPSVEEPPATAFTGFVDNLHREKSAAYGDSWKKRGEQMSILANVARKIDRLEGGESTEDEVIADTAIDLLVYLVKYRRWLSERHPSLPHYVVLESLNENDYVRAVLNWLSTLTSEVPPENLVPRLLGGFSSLEDVVSRDPSRTFSAPERAGIVQEMILDAFTLARALWEQERGDTGRNATRFWAGYGDDDNV